MEAGKTPSSSSSDVSLIPPQHLWKKWTEEEEDNSVSLPSSSSKVGEAFKTHACRRPTPYRVVGFAGLMKQKEKDYFIVKLSQNGNLDGEQDELIHKQEAACRLCSKLLGEADSVLKTKCKCQFTLLHTTCGDQWSPMCDSCQRIILTVPVTISSSHPNSRQETKKVELAALFYEDAIETQCFTN